MRLLILISIFLVSACSTTTVENSDWVDIPLSENTYSEGHTTYQSGTYHVDVPAFTALEYKIGMIEGDSIVYTWNVEMSDPSLLTAEFHGHTERLLNEQPGTVMFYKIHNDGQESGVLTAPFSGIHGWYLNNESEENIVIQLQLSGFYQELQQ